MADPLCPACGRRLSAGSLGSATVQLCSGCGGVWFSVPALLELLGSGAGDLPRLYGQVQPDAVARDAASACPYCALPFERLVVPELPGSLVLACTPCRGFWFSRTTLERLIPEA